MSLPIPIEGLLPALFQFPLGDLKLKKGNNQTLFQSYLDEIFRYWYEVVTNQVVVVGMSEYFDSHNDFWARVRAHSLEVGNQSDSLFQCYCSMSVLGSSFDMEPIPFEKFKEVSCVWVTVALRPEKTPSSWAAGGGKSANSVLSQVRSLTCS